MIMRTGVRKTIIDYWFEGVLGATLLMDAVALALLTLDAVRFRAQGFTVADAVRLGTEKLSQGDSVGLAIAVLLFFIVALPSAMALFTYLYPQSKEWRLQSWFRGKWVLPAHIFLSLFVAAATVIVVAMEVLSGWEKSGTPRYAFESYWLATVLFAKPIYVAYVSPIIRKLLVRFGANPARGSLGELARDTTKEVLTEDSIGHE